jgi:predicted nucleic-acid-binding Zn-ribbon protein
MQNVDPCPKCRGEMEQGFIVDRGHANVSLVSSWVPGPPKKSFWRATKVDRTIPVGVFRCSRCGFLEAYARPEFKAQ